MGGCPFQLTELSEAEENTVDHLVDMKMGGHTSDCIIGWHAAPEVV